MSDRLDRIEAILRDHDLHEPNCPVRRAQRWNALGGSYAIAKECDCWLSDDSEVKQ